MTPENNNTSVCQDILVTSAYGSWKKGVPPGFVGVRAIKGGRQNNGDLAIPGEVDRYFLVPVEEYRSRGENTFVVDPTRHIECTFEEAEKAEDERFVTPPYTIAELLKARLNDLPREVMALKATVGQLQSALGTLLAVTDEYDHARGDGNLEPFQRAIKDRLDSAYVAADRVLRKSLATLSTEPEALEEDSAPHP